MKNAFKLGLLALALSLSVVACNSEKKAGASD
jgi:predicted small lipoprotein YifL